MAAFVRDVGRPALAAFVRDVVLLALLGVISGADAFAACGSDAAGDAASAFHASTEARINSVNSFSVTSFFFFFFFFFFFGASATGAGVWRRVRTKRGLCFASPSMVSWCLSPCIASEPRVR